MNSTSPLYVVDSVCTGDIVAASKEGCVSPFAGFAERWINLLFTALFGIVGMFQSSFHTHYSYDLFSPMYNANLCVMKGWMLCLYYALRCSFGTARSNCDTGSSIRNGVWVISKGLGGGCGLTTAGGRWSFYTSGGIWNPGGFIQ